jgi:Flp pilus assembly pilin Flp
MPGRLVRRRLSALAAERGQSLVEVSLLLVLISIVAVGLLTAIGADVIDLMDNVIPIGPRS